MEARSVEPLAAESVEKSVEKKQNIEHSTKLALSFRRPKGFGAESPTLRRIYKSFSKKRIFRHILIYISAYAFLNVWIKCVDATPIALPSLTRPLHWVLDYSTDDNTEFAVIDSYSFESILQTKQFSDDVIYFFFQYNTYNRSDSRRKSKLLKNCSWWTDAITANSGGWKQ